MVIKRKLLGQEIEIRLTSVELNDAYYEELRDRRRSEVKNYLSAIATSSETSERMNEYQAAAIMCEMIDHPDLLDRVVDRYESYRDRYPDGEQEMNCVVDACFNELTNMKEEK